MRESRRRESASRNAAGEPSDDYLVIEVNKIHCTHQLKAALGVATSE